MEIDEQALKKVYDSIERARIELYRAVNHTIKKGELPEIILPADDWKVEYNGRVIKISIPDYPPKTRYAQQRTKQRWINNVMFAIRSIKPLPQFKKVFVIVVFYIPDEDWDVDNRDVSPIINGIRYSRIIQSDSYQHVSYAAVGYYSNDPHTDIYIIDNFNPLEILDIVNKNSNPDAVE